VPPRRLHTVASGKKVGAPWPVCHISVAAARVAYLNSLYRESLHEDPEPVEKRS
jgi:hypothetical protein